ncbi:MAG: ATP-dependent 6-phosphofructokinase [Candidatus Omnitrophica bacterium]|jgi:6-phosphofructokinase 1|nr:ATP-dependent 6-phosphofructokinase [Candidatus Omnitrophota bacterium]
MERIGILTGGGDCPGLNPVIRAAVRKGLLEGYEFLGIKDGWKGLVENMTMPLDINAVSGILHKGGTILGTSRTNPYKKEGGLQRVKDNFKKMGLSALIAIGGEDTLGVASKLVDDGLTNIVGVPKTIDNDLSSTDYTFGFDTALNIVTECIDRLHSTAESHHRVIVVEVMGRHAGWIAVEAGIAGGADVTLIPEVPINIEEVCNTVTKRHSRGKNFSIVVVAEGAQFADKGMVLQEQKLDAFGHVRLGGIGEALAGEIEKRTGFETRVSVLGHIQRGGAPTAFDRVLATRLGIKAVELIKGKKFGRMVALQGIKVVDVPLKDAVKELKTVDLELYNIAKVFSL